MKICQYRNALEGFRACSPETLIALDNITPTLAYNEATTVYVWDKGEAVEYTYTRACDDVECSCCVVRTIGAPAYVAQGKRFIDIGIIGQVILC